eukprot:4397200-Prymnesium_polylepis.5
MSSMSGDAVLKRISSPVACCERCFLEMPLSPVALSHVGTSCSCSRWATVSSARSMSEGQFGADVPTHLTGWPLPCMTGPIASTLASQSAEWP